MNFLVDAHLPPALGQWLRTAGHAAVHASELPAKNQATGAVINEISARQGRVVISKDTDFYYSHLLTGKPHKLLLISAPATYGCAICATCFSSICPPFSKRSKPTRLSNWIVRRFESLFKLP